MSGEDEWVGCEWGGCEWGGCGETPHLLHTFTLDIHIQMPVS